MSPAPSRIRVRLDTDHWWAECQGCTWEKPLQSLSAAYDAGVDHLPRCGREMYLRPASFTHQSDGHPLVIASPTMDDLYWGSDVLACGSGRGLIIC